MSDNPFWLPGDFFRRHTCTYTQGAVSQPGWIWACSCDDESGTWFASRELCVFKTHEHWGEEIDKIIDGLIDQNTFRVSSKTQDACVLAVCKALGGAETEPALRAVSAIRLLGEANDE